MLASIKIPASVEKVEVLAFHDSGLESVVFEYGSILVSIGSFVSKICILTFISYIFSQWHTKTKYSHSCPKAFRKTPLLSINIPKNFQIGWKTFEQTGCEDSSIFISGATICQCKIVPVFPSTT